MEKYGTNRCGARRCRKKTKYDPESASSFLGANNALHETGSWLHKGLADRIMQRQEEILYR